MSGQPNVWQTGSRSRTPAARTPQNRSGTASPAPQNAGTQSPRQDGGRQQQQNNVWSQRSSSIGGSNGQLKNEQSVEGKAEQQHASANGFNAADVKASLARVPVPATYKAAEISGGGKGAWGAKPNHMANNQPFFVQLAKQIATLEGGG